LIKIFHNELEISGIVIWPKNNTHKLIKKEGKWKYYRNRTNL